VSDFSVQSAPYSDDSVLLIWKRISTVDVDSYEILSSNQNLDGASPDLVDVSATRVVDVNESTAYDSFFLDSAGCERQENSCIPEYDAIIDGEEAKVNLIPDQLYFIDDLDSYMYVLQTSENNFGILAISEEQESPAISGGSAEIKDILPAIPPALTRSVESDGSIVLRWSEAYDLDGGVSDVDYYELFCTSQSSATYGSLIEENQAPIKTVSDQAKETVVDTGIINALCSGKNNFVLIPVDSSLNRYPWEIPTS
jgi:hypothetical protein